ncbi:MAG: hypothetical protein K2L96_06435 [Muribaculaceae bacterium]|nr:hypothetical protein [Muribaculaceae bacterium]
MAKLLKYLLIFMLPLAFAACDKDEPKNDKDDDNNDDDRTEYVEIAGTWTGTVDFDEDGEGYDMWSEKWTLVLKTNGKFTLDCVELDYDDEYSLYGIYTYDEDREKLRLTVQGDDEEGDWGEDSETVTFGCRISGNKMYLSGNDIDGTATLTRKK